MRWALAAMFLVLMGCNVTRTVPLADAGAYFQGKTVVTREGYPLSLDDGGIMSPIARKGLCLEKAGEDVIAVGDKDVPLLILAAEPGSDCAVHPVAGALRASLGDDTLTIVGRKRAVRAPTEAVYGLRVHAPKNGSDAPLDGVYKTEPRSTALAVAGAAFIAGGIGAAIGLGVERSKYDDDDQYQTRDLYTGLLVFSLGAGVGGGTTMVAIGGTKVRAPVEVDRVSVELGAGTAAAGFAF